MTRDRKWATALVVVAILGFGALGYRTFLGPGPDVEVVRVSAHTQGDGTATVAFAGDTLLGDQSTALLRRHGYDWPFAHLDGVLDADYVIANAEGPITTRTKLADPTLQYSYNSDPRAAQALRDAGVDALGLANNHAMDRGPQGLADTIEHAHGAGLATFGAGATPADAAAPLMITTDAGTIAVLGMGEDFGQLMRVSDTRPGMTVMREDRIRAAYFTAKAAGADYVVAYTHWGDNYQPVNRAQRAFARVFAEAGYDLVIGTGPHVGQPFRVVDGMPVLYSLGNFVFGTPGRWETYGAEGYGVVATVNLQPAGASLDLRCVVTDNAVVHYQPRPCTPAEAERVLTQVSPDVTIRNGAGSIPLPTFTPSA